MNNDELLEKIGKLIEVEREHTKRIIREELTVEVKRLTGQQAILANHIDVSLNRIEDRIKDVEISSSRIEEKLSALEAGQKNIQERIAPKPDIKKLP